jgi:hypothetical protein
MLRKLWHDPVWSKVIAGVILTVGAGLGTYVLDWWPAIGRFTTVAINFSLSSTLAPNWLLGVLSLVSIPTIIMAMVIAWVLLFPPQPNTLDCRSYTTDIFFGLRWRWTYASGMQILNKATCCPNCDYQVYADAASAFSAIDRISFHCENCGRNLGEFTESVASLENRVDRLIQLKIRNGSWVTENKA